MENKVTLPTKVISTAALLQKFVLEYFSGAKPKAVHWIKLAPNLLANLDAKQLDKTLEAIFNTSMAGFKCRNTFKDEGNIKAAFTVRQFWEFVAKRGFTDHISDFMDTWHKPYALPAPKFNYAYSAAGALPDKWDTNAVYSHVLGSSPTFFRDELYNEEFFKKHNITSIVEPMAACAELCYFGHFTHPELSYSMLDLDQSAADRTRALPWAAGTKKEYIVGDVLKPAAWNRLKLPKASGGKSLCFIGKQSQNIFSPSQVVDLIELAMQACDFVVFETMEYPASYFFEKDNRVTDLTPVHLKNTPITVSLDVLEGHSHNRVSFESNLQVALHWGKKVRPFITYQPWHCYTPSTLIALAMASLPVKHENIMFQDDAGGNYVPLLKYSEEPRTVGSLKRHNADTAGSVINLMFTRHKQR